MSLVAFTSCTDGSHLFPWQGWQCLGVVLIFQSQSLGHARHINLMLNGQETDVDRIPHTYFFLNPHLRTFFFIVFRERGREKEKH